MAENEKVVYGFYSFQEDAISVSRGLNQWVQKYLQANKQLHPPSSPVQQYWTGSIGEDTKPPSFYNNMEVVRIAFFRKPVIKAFNRAVDGPTSP